MPDTYQSDTHKNIVNVRLCGEFLVRGEIQSNYTGKHFYQYSEQLRAMAAGTVQLWDLDRPDIQKFSIYVMETWLSIVTSSQLAEQWVKDSNECTFTSKEGKIANIYDIIRSRTVIYFNDNASKQNKNRIRKATKYLTKGKLGGNIDKRVGTTEVVDDKNRDDIRGALLVDKIITQTIKMRDKIKI